MLQIRLPFLATLLGTLLGAATLPVAWGQASSAAAPSNPKDQSAAAAAFATGREAPLLSYRREETAGAEDARRIAETEQNALRRQAAAPAPIQPFAAPPVVFDPAVQRTAGEAETPTQPLIEEAPPVTASPLAAAPAPVSADATGRRLAPPSSRARRFDSNTPTSRAASFLPQALGQFKSLSSAGAALAVVVALFLICMSFVRRGGSKTGGSLPSEAFSVLGRAPLTAQSYAQLVRLGNKLVLVAVGADGAQPLAEVTDPLEVDRIAGLCVKTAPHGPSAEFQQVLAQLSREPAKGFLGREASTARRRA